MKITQEVRDFAAKQNSDSYLAATVPVADAEAGMDEMSRVYRERGKSCICPRNESTGGGTRTGAPEHVSTEALIT